MLDVVALVSLVLAVLSFALFAVLAVIAVMDKRKAPKAVGEGAVDDVTKLIGQLEKLAGTLSKSAPWLSALIAFFFCLTIAFGAASGEKLSEKIPSTSTPTAK